MGIDNMPKPLLSICCVTYNHENYIRECLNGFVTQKTTFHFEILVHEDASTDNTAQIVKEYESKFPHLFRCVYQTENQFAKQNTLVNILFPMSQGKYIALCEGDDYWTDPYKLQKQVDFLEANPGYSICFHNAEIIDEGTQLSEGLFVGLQKQQYVQLNSSREVLPYEIMIDWIVPTASCLFRSNLIDYKKINSNNFVFGDIALFLSLTAKGKVFYLNEIMSVYRKSLRGARFSNDGEYKNGRWERHYNELTRLCPDKELEFVINYFKCEVLIYSRAFFFYDLNWITSYQKHKAFKKTFSQMNKSNNAIPLNIKKRMLNKLTEFNNSVNHDQRKSISVKRYAYVLFKKSFSFIRHFITAKT
jgi:glycosyltransferase involved in cell wall biosynthesis